MPLASFSKEGTILNRDTTVRPNIHGQNKIFDSDGVIEVALTIEKLLYQ